MRTWLEVIRDSDNQAKAAAAAREHEAVEAFKLRTTPVHIRLASLIKSMPPSERNKPRPLEFYRKMLQARHRGKHAHVGETGEALRTLGYVRKRNFSKAEQSFSAMWYPPTSTPCDQ